MIGASGLQLTKAGYLPPRIVEKSNRYYQDSTLPRFATSREFDMIPLWRLRDWAAENHLVHIRRGMLQ